MNKPRKQAPNTQRGYGAAHKTERAKWAPIVATGKAKCWRCHTPLNPNLPWHLGHDDHDRRYYRGPECVKCNCGTPRNKTRTTPKALKLFQ